jgi:hypothetical protein
LGFQDRSPKSSANKEGLLPTLQQTIVAKFLAKLAEVDDVDTKKIEQLRILLENDKKANAGDFVNIFTAPAGGDVK